MEDNYKCDMEILLQWMFGMVDQNSQKIELADLFILGTCLCRAKEAIKMQSMLDKIIAHYLCII